MKRHIDRFGKNTKLFLYLFPALLILGITTINLIKISDSDMISRFTSADTGGTVQTENTVVFYPTDDVLVKDKGSDEERNKNYNKGIQLDHLRTRYKPGDELYESLFKFDLSGFNGPANRALLRLFSYDIGKSDLILSLVENNWQESTVTWNTKPPIITDNIATTNAPLTNNVWVEFDITNIVNANLNSIVSLNIRNATTENGKNSYYFRSRETNTKPELVIFTSGSSYTTPIPTITTSINPTQSQSISPTRIPTLVIPSNTPQPTTSPTYYQPLPTGTGGIWIKPNRLATLPTSGSAWNNLLSYANKPAQIPELSNQDDPANTIVFAQALVYARTGDRQYADKVIKALEVVCDPSYKYIGRALALAREIGTYPVTADLINLKTYNSGLYSNCINKFRYYLTVTTSKGPSSLTACYHDRANNWGTHCMASAGAIAIYLNDQAVLNEVTRVFKGWLGNRNLYAGFKYGDLSWQCNPQAPVGINPKGCTKNGLNIDGVMPDDQRRCGKFSNPPCKTNYAWGAQQGTLGMAIILYEAGVTDIWEYQDKALLRAVQWLYNIGNSPAGGDDAYLLDIIDYYYGTNYSYSGSQSPGKTFGFANWTHAH